VISNGRECSGNQHGLFNRTAHRRDATNFVDCWSNYREIQPLRASDVAVKNFADMQAEIHIGDREAVGGAALVEFDDPLSRSYRGGKGRIARALPIVHRKNGEHSVAHELQDITPVTMKSRDNYIRIVVEEGNDMLRRCIGDSREAAQIAEPEHCV